MHIEFGVSRQIVSRWENGLAIPRATKIKTICDEFNISPDTLLGKENIEMQDIEIEKEESDKSNVIIKKISIVAICILTLYVMYFMYKFIIVTKINTKMKEYNNWTNYYAEIDTYEDAKQLSKTTIWFKDNRYKIIAENYSNNPEEKKIIRYINVEDRVRTEFINDKVEVHNEDYLGEMFDDKKYILEFFPWFNNFNNNKIITCLRNNIYYKKEKGNIKIKFGNKTIYYEDDWIIPISYSDSDKEKITFMSYKIQKNTVKDEDVEIKEDL